MTRLNHGDLPALIRAQAIAILEPIIRSMVTDVTGIVKKETGWEEINDSDQEHPIVMDKLKEIFSKIEFVVGDPLPSSYLSRDHPIMCTEYTGLKSLISDWIIALHDNYWEIFDGLSYPPSKRAYLKLNWGKKEVRTQEMDFSYLLDWQDDETPMSFWLHGFNMAEEYTLIDRLMKALAESITNSEFKWADKTDPSYYGVIFKGIYIRLKLMKSEHSSKEIFFYLNDDQPNELGINYERCVSVIGLYPTRRHVVTFTIANILPVKKAIGDKGGKLDGWEVDWSDVRFGYDGLNHPDIAYPKWKGESSESFDFSKIVSY